MWDKEDYDNITWIAGRDIDIWTPDLHYFTSRYVALPLHVSLVFDHGQPLILRVVKK